MSEEIHLINPLWNACSGAELLTVELCHLLSAAGHSVQLWSEHDPDERLTAQFRISRISLPHRRFPMSGIFVFVGNYYSCGNWIRSAHPKRTILIHNTPNVFHLLRRIQKLKRMGPTVEVVFVSKMSRTRAGLPGPIDPGWIDLDRFRPPQVVSATSAKGHFSVGRLSRAEIYKFHYTDPQLYRDLAREGCHVRIMGGDCIRGTLRGIRGVELLPAGSRDAADFLRDLDCFIYRTADCMPESMGRVVYEAMACGLPVVCHERGGYIENIIHGKNGFLYRTNREAREIVLMLRAEPDLRRAIGHAARATMEAIFSEPEMAKRIAFYASPTARPSDSSDTPSHGGLYNILADWIDRKVGLGPFVDRARIWRHRLLRGR